MNKALICLLVSLVSISLYSNKIQDKEIAKAILDSNKEITFEVINEVLEFDPENQVALKEKILLLYHGNNSLYEIKELFSEITDDDLTTNRIKLEVLYRLGQYEYIINNRKLFAENDSPKSVYYISDSYIRKGIDSIALELIKEGLYENPYNTLLNELNYLLTLDSGSLRIIRQNGDGYNSLIRLHSRMDSQKKGHSLIEKILNIRITNTSINEFSYLNLSYPFLELISHRITEDVNGEFSFDKDSDGFIETVFNVNKGILLYKGVDLDGDKIFDNEIWLNKGIPEKIRHNEIVLNYGLYPYINSIVCNDDSIREIIRFTKNKVVYRPQKLTVDNIISLNDYKDFGSIIEKEIFNSNLYEKWIYKDSNTILKYKDEEKLGFFSHITLEENGNVISGVRDLNFDGQYDIHENYIGGVLVGAAFVNHKKYTYYEGYEPMNIKIITDDNNIRRIIIKSNNNRDIALPIEDEYSVEDIINIERDNYNWWIEK